MELSVQQEQRLIQALGGRYLSQLFANHDTGGYGPCFTGGFLLAKALQKVIGGDLYTLSGYYLVTNRPINYHIFLKKDDSFWDCWGMHTIEDLPAIWQGDNLEKIQVRPFKEADLKTVGLDNSWGGDYSGHRFFEVRHGDQYDPFIANVSQYLDLALQADQEMVTLCVWPCGTVCELEEVEGYSWMSDDYSTVEMPIGLDQHVFAAAYLSKLRDRHSLVAPDPEGPVISF